MSGGDRDRVTYWVERVAHKLMGRREARIVHSRFLGNSGVVITTGRVTCDAS